MSRFFSAERIIFVFTLLVLIVLVILPLFVLVWKSFYVEEQLSLANYLKLFTDRLNVQAFVNTIILGFSTVILSILLGVPIAWLVTRTDLPHKEQWRSVIMTTYIIPPFIGAIAWEQLLTQRVGYLNKLLEALPFIEHSTLDIHSLAGIIWVMALHQYPFVFITTVSALSRMDPSFEEAARISGAGRFKVLFSITLPLVAPSIAAGAIMSFVLTIANFGTPAILGMQERIFVLTTMIVNHKETGNMGSALTLALVLVVLAIACVAINNLYFSRKKLTLISGKSIRPADVKLGKMKIPAIILLSFIAIVSIVIPLLSMFVSSLVKSEGMDLHWRNLTLEHYNYVLFEYGGEGFMGRVFFNSLFLGFASATIIVLLASLISYITIKTNIKGRNLLDFTTMVSFTVPASVVGLAVMYTWTGRFGIDLKNTLWILLLAYVSHYLAVGVRTIAPTLEQIHPSLEEAGRIAGANWFRTFKDIVLPLVKPGLIAGWFLVFIPSLRELTMSALLVGYKNETIGYVVYKMQEGASLQNPAALGIIILVMVVAGESLVKRLSKGKVGL